MRRIPLRLRLTLVFVVVMALVLGAIGSFVYLRTKQNIDDSIEQSLRARQSALRQFAADPPPRARSLIPAGERYAQLQRLDGSVIESRPLATPPMLSASQLREAARHPAIFEKHEQVRYFAGAVKVRGRPAVAVAAASLADHERALEGLGGALVIGGPLALLVGAAIAYAVASGALRPIETMRRRAASISRAHPDARLPVPDVDDEVRRLAVTLNEMLVRLSETAETERRLIANASHELRTPLSALQAELDLALRPGADPAELRPAVERVRADVLRLTELSNALLDLSSQEEKSVHEFEPAAAEALLTDAAAGLQQRVSAAGRKIVVRPTHAVVTGDWLELRRAVTNLVENALVHGRGTITLGADDHGEITHVWVQDEGTIDPQTAASAFDRFARGPESVNRPGVGLGLSLVRTIARQHGGDASLRAIDGGVRAQLDLPKHHAAADVNPSA